jgi:hypothetical protein
LIAGNATGLAGLCNPIISFPTKRCVVFVKEDGFNFKFRDKVLDDLTMIAVQKEKLASVALDLFGELLKAFNHEAEPVH